MGVRDKEQIDPVIYARIKIKSAVVTRSCKSDLGICDRTISPACPCPHRCLNLDAREGHGIYSLLVPGAHQKRRSAAMGATDHHWWYTGVLAAIFRLMRSHCSNHCSNVVDYQKKE
jgi:hypothetical protein